MPNIIFEATFNSRPRIATILNHRWWPSWYVSFLLSVYWHEMLQLLVNQNQASHFLINWHVSELINLKL